MKPLLPILLVFAPLFLVGQTKLPNKAETAKKIKQNIALIPDYSKSAVFCEKGICGDWYCNNKDSSFYKADTLVFYNSSNAMYDSNHYCLFKIWQFKKWNNFVQSNIEICHEPPLTTTEYAYAFLLPGKKRLALKSIPVAPANYFVMQYKGAAFIVLCTAKKIFAIYKVISIQNYKAGTWGNNAVAMTLVRQSRP